MGFAQFIDDYQRSPAVRLKYRGKTAALNATSEASAAIAREIEKLAPAVDRACSPENAEYPWERGDWEAGTGEVLVPCVYAYPSVSLLKNEKGRAFLKIVQEAPREWTP